VNTFVLHYGSYCLAPFGLVGMWLAGRRNRWGWALSMATQTLWLAYAYLTAQYGFMIGTISYGFIYLRNFIQWKTEISAQPDASSDSHVPGSDRTPCMTCHSH
jgi:hypothetical protein